MQGKHFLESPFVAEAKHIVVTAAIIYGKKLGLPGCVRCKGETVGKREAMNFRTGRFEEDFREGAREARKVSQPPSYTQHAVASTVTS